MAMMMKMTMMIMMIEMKFLRKSKLCAYQADQPPSEHLNCRQASHDDESCSRREAASFSIRLVRVGFRSGSSSRGHEAH